MSEFNRREFNKNRKIRACRFGVIPGLLVNTKVILLPFFGSGALETLNEMNYIADLRRNLEFTRRMVLEI